MVHRNSWIMADVGLVPKVMEPTGWTGKVMLFFAARVLDVLYLFTVARAILGYKPADDAAELPN